jgi:hypothetical protein
MAVVSGRAGSFKAKFKPSQTNIPCGMLELSSLCATENFE